ncbi:MAG: helix-turn-helix domain-containing protein [Clostridia bacterium]|nr:helix-turn-helix domain-containing protein [Clostridia bacterium]MCR5689487.1 helix-turn-helix domain-containing protein [Clostridiales bacterium]
MSSRLFQQLIHQMKDVISPAFGVVDEGGTIIACSDLSRIGEEVGSSVSPCFSSNGSVVIDGRTYHAFGAQIHPEYAVFVDGDDEKSASDAAIIAISLSSVKQYYDEKYDRSNFIKNVILDNILPGDIYLKSRELHFNNDATRAVLLLRISEPTDVSVYDIVQNLFPDKTRDFVININETDIALVKEVRPDIDSRDLEKLGRSISDSIGAECYIRMLVGIGSPVTGIKELARSFKDAQVALEVSKVFDTEKTIISYEHLGIARLIYQLPTTLCEMFLKEVFKRGSIDNLDQDTLFTIQTFFDYNLNVSETSRQLFVHRNTLVYRLEKIHERTGLDLRDFDDAIVLKVALMVKRYLDTRPDRF